MNPGRRRLNVSLTRCFLAAFFATCACAIALAQANSNLVDPLLAQHLQSQSVVANELQHFMLQRVPPLQLPATAKQWDQEAGRIRARELSVLYHGWPQAWIDSAPSFEQVGVIERDGYRIVKLRYQVVPGMFSTALLYEPDKISSKIPAILNVNGHGPGGKAVGHKQARCINYARRGMLALDMEWFDYGDLDQPGNAHENARLLDLAGYNGAGLFYLEMRRGLDYLYDNPTVDRTRIGVTGVSGGGWQTIMLSSLDTRVGPAAPVAGFSSLTTSIEHPEYSGNDAEQNPSDFRHGVDYAQLMAVRAPRPTLLMYNAMDDCCFRAGVLKQGVYFDIKPFFNLYGKPDNLQWHLNLDPGTHNYGLDNREASYKFFDYAFHIDASPDEFPDTDTEIQSAEDLAVPVPKDNLTILTLAQSLAKSIHHEVPAQPSTEWASTQREQLKQVVRYTPVTVTHAWPISATHEKGVESHAYRFEFSNGLSATGILFRSVTAPENASTTILIADAGMPSTMVDVADDVDRGQRVLVLNPLFFGEEKLNAEDRSGATVFAQLLTALGERPLGMEAAQVNAVVHWLNQDLDHGSPTPNNFQVQEKPVPPVRIVTTGPRSQIIAMVAAAIHPELFSALESRESVPSLATGYDHPENFVQAPEMMCLDLYRDFDINTLAAIAAPVKVDLTAVAPKRIFWE
ncbi:MAG: prolyl oligopeptidase family serine peptidase [Acidobacteriaceae bacterium]